MRTRKAIEIKETTSGAPKREKSGKAALDAAGFNTIRFSMMDG